MARHFAAHRTSHIFSLHFAKQHVWRMGGRQLVDDSVWNGACGGGGVTAKCGVAVDLVVPSGFYSLL